jgi:hypothetical protein
MMPKALVRQAALTGAACSITYFVANIRFFKWSVDPNPPLERRMPSQRTKLDRFQIPS